MSESFEADDDGTESPAAEPVVPAPGATEDRPGTRRPAIEKNLAGKRIIIPEGHALGEQMSPGQAVVYWLTWGLSVALGRTYFRVRIRGRQHVPSTGPFILAPVHRSNLDTPLVALATRRRLRFMGKESLWKRGWSAWYFTAAGGFPVERATADRRALNACLDVLQRGEPLVLFPEGTRQSGPVVAEMFDGAAWLACRAQCPIVPLGVGGSARALGKGMRFPRPVRMTLVVGEPIVPAPPTAAGRTSRRAVRELTEQLRSRLQELFDEAEALTGSPRPS
jgi:1-acyl-sn-glycerol-3-phosphate acyltransferase